MYEPHEINVTPVVARNLIDLPLNILLALPDYATEVPSAAPFNLPAAINYLVGRQRGWDVAVKVLRPHVWAPGWDDRQLHEFVL